MSKEEIGKSIEALHAEIEQLDTPNTAVKEKLLALIEGMEKQIQDPIAQSIKKRLRSSYRV